MINPIRRISQICTTNVVEKRFAGYDGGYPADNGLARGIYEFDQDSGYSATIITDGVAEIVLSGTVIKGNEITSDATGRGKVAVAGNYVNGIALKGGDPDDTIQVELKSFKI